MGGKKRILPLEWRRGQVVKRRIVVWTGVGFCVFVLFLMRFFLGGKKGGLFEKTWTIFLVFQIYTKCLRCTVGRGGSFAQKMKKNLNKICTLSKKLSTQKKRLRT